MTRFPSAGHRRRTVGNVPLLAMLAALALAKGASAAGMTLPGSIQGEARYSGDLRLEGAVTVQPGATLIIEAGSTLTVGREGLLQVLGRLQVLGTDKAPVKFKGGPEGWTGVSLLDGASASVNSAIFEGARSALSLLAARGEVRNSRFGSGELGVHLVREAVCLVENSRFEKLKAGVVVEMKSEGLIRRCSFRGLEAGVSAASGGAPTVENCRFTDNGVGVFVQQRLARPIRGNLFEGNRFGIRLFQNGPDTLVEKNLFRDNAEAAVEALSYSSPTIANNRIQGGKYGIFTNQFSSPQIRNNSISGAKEALHLDRKNISRVLGNVIAASQTGVFLDYSSYPVMRDNVFDGNGVHLRLGRFQSSQWELEAGSKQFVMQTAAGLGSRNPRLAEASESFPEAVDASGNWWDEKTRSEMDEKGPAADITSLYDGFDEPEVTYEGFGEKKYRLDKVTYVPRLQTPPDGVGLQGWKGKDNELDLP